MSASDVIELSHRFELFIPTQCICGENIDGQLRAEALDLVKGEFHDWFGGATVKPVNGIWKLPDGTIADEKVDIVDSLADDYAFDDYIDDAKRLAVSIADKLSQDRVLLKVDEKGFLFSRSDDQAKCSHKKMRGSHDSRPVIDVPKNDPVLIYYTLSRFSSPRDARKLFCNVLNYKMVTADLPTGNWPQTTKTLLKEFPEVIADTNGFRIVYIRLAADRLLRGPERLIIQRIYQDDPTFRGLFVISDADQENWEFVNVKTRGKKAGKFVLRRMKVGNDAVRTATERIIKVQIKENEEKSITAADLQERHDEAFDVESVTKQFYKELSDWYFWALTQVEFPDDLEKNIEVRNAENIIRLITRLIFVWFLKEKGLVPAALFNNKDLVTILDFSKEKTGSAYYKAILQNLFFATLNVPMTEREFHVEKRYKGRNKDYMNHLVFRYANLFTKEGYFKELFGEIPFLNGGLFDCLDFIQDGQQMRIDCFSDNPKNIARLKVPDELFFGKTVVDLSAAYGDKKQKSVKVRGIIGILSSYNFTLEENTPVEEEIALDPELLGRVFENLLASYNPETKSTARKQTGSFYTPRVIVNYMVDESLKAYLSGIIGEDEATRNELDQLLEYDGVPSWSDKQKKQIIDALDDVKILDPACGSGAFPMGMLQKMVHILEKLDPGNEKWKETMVKRTPAEIRKETERLLASNTADYIRKLGIIQNCIYGVDIQPIAIQVSKLRFFISLLVDFSVDKNKENLDIQPMPNLDYKLMQGNSLIEDFHGFTLNVCEQESVGTSSLFSENEEVDGLILDLWEKQRSYLREIRVNEKERLRDEVEQNIIKIFDNCIRKRKIPYFAELKRMEDMARRIPNLEQRKNYLSAEKTKIDRKHKFDYQAVEKELKDLTHGHRHRNFFPWQLYFAEVFKKKSGFDIVIGNPPYGIPIPRELRNEYTTFALGGESYILFVERAVRLLKEGGQLSYIIPDTYLNLSFTAPLREYLLRQSYLREIVVLPSSVFATATVDTTLLFVEKAQYHKKVHESNVKVKIFAKQSKQIDMENADRNTQVSTLDWQQHGTFNVQCDAAEIKLISRISKQCKTVGDVAILFYGIKAYQVGKGKPPQTEIVRSTKPYTSIVRKNKEYLPFYDGKHVGHYNLLWKEDNWIHYGPWLAEPRKPEKFIGEKILIRKIVSDTLIATYVPVTSYCNTLLYVMKLNQECSLSYKFVLGVLNSTFIGWFFRKKFQISSDDTFPQIMIGDILNLPIPDALTKNQTHVVALVEKILDATQKDSKSDLSVLKAKLDALIFQHYGLTKMEIDMVQCKK